MSVYYVSLDHRAFYDFWAVNVELTGPDKHALHSINQSKSDLPGNSNRQVSGQATVQRLVMRFFYEIEVDEQFRAIHQLKYRQDRGLGEVLAQPLIDLIGKYHWKIDLIIPVPLDSARRKERGYNQAALLARPISWHTGIPYSGKSLKRERITRQQVGLSLSERAENMAGAFKAYGSQVAGNNVLVVDDVITTGSTLNACSHALIMGGADQVFGLTLARSSHV